MGRLYSIPCRYFVSVDLEEYIGKIASAARNLINSALSNKCDNLCLCFCINPASVALYTYSTITYSKYVLYCNLYSTVQYTRVKWFLTPNKLGTCQVGPNCFRTYNSKISPFNPNLHGPLKQSWCTVDGKAWFKEQGPLCVKCRGYIQKKLPFSRVFLTVLWVWLIRVGRSFLLQFLFIHVHSTLLSYSFTRSSSIGTLTNQSSTPWSTIQWSCTL